MNNPVEVSHSNDAYHTAASSVLPDSKKKSARTLKSLPGEEAAPIPLLRFDFAPGTPRVDCRRLLVFPAGPRLGPVDELRFKFKLACALLWCADPPSSG